jgi:hypothetical protein
MCGMICSTSYNLTVSGPNPNLITLPNPTKQKLSFAASQNLADAGLYTIEVKWSADGGINWSAAETATFTYLNPCVNAIFETQSCFSPLTLNVGEVKATTLPSLWNDNVT